MKIAFCVRKNFLTRHGGDSVQILKTKEKLESLYKDCSVDVITNPPDINDSYDIAHIFNLVMLDDCIEYYTQAKKKGLITALSSIHWDNEYVSHVHLGKFFRYYLNKYVYCIEKIIANIFVRLIGHPYLLSNDYKNKAGELLKGIDIALPNSAEEGEHLCKLLKSNKEITEFKKKIKVVFNAIENYQNLEFKGSLEINDFVLQVGRIEPRKNQIGTVRALFKENNIPIVFLGKAYPDQKAYFLQLKRIADKRGNVHFFDEIPHGETALFYKRASVHVLPSLQETTGLVALEALSLGCKACLSNNNYIPVDTYYKGIATIIDPLDIQSIHDGILQEINTKRDMSAISKHISDNFNWDVTARQTYEAYCSVLNRE